MARPRPHRLERTTPERSIVQFAAVLSVAAAAAFAIGGIVSGDTGYLARSLGPAIVATVAGIQIALGREWTPPILILAAVVPAVQVKLYGVANTEVGAVVGLAAVGMVALLTVTRHRTAFVVAYGGFIVAAEFWWWSGTGYNPTSNALSGVAAFVGGAFVLMMVQREGGAAAFRHHHLFETAPVPLWEQDFTAVSDWLAALRTRGVTDLAGYLDANPAALRIAAGLIEVRDVNDAAIRMLEADDRDQLLGRGPAGYLDGPAVAALAPLLSAVWEDRDRASAELHDGRTRTGKPLEAVIHWAAPRLGPRLDLSRVMVAVVDVTENREARKHLEGLLRAKDEFVATVSHELRTPLTAVVGLAAELEDGGDHIDAAEAAELISLVASQAREVSTIVDDLLVAAQAGSGTLTVVNESLDLAHEASTVIKAMAAEDAVAMHAWGTVPMAQGDPGRVRQVIRNLIVNAQRYGGDAVRVVVYGAEGQVTAEIRDTGGPIPEHQRAAIFEPYYRARQVTGVTASVGLGLTVSRELVRLMEGDLVYFHDGEESVFALTLPTAPA